MTERTDLVDVPTAGDRPELSLTSVEAENAGGGCGCGGCGCGGAEAEAAPAVELAPDDLDVRTLAPAQRHQQIFARIAQLEPGEQLVLVNDHDPKPLRYQLDAEEPGQITWEYLAEGPEVWRVRIGRVPGHCC
ncbi:DUF2249 domain-containing protein [Cellulomonas sp. APG4]|uniref:DUF2249 domain-containing protein n=1 Tax=Cellulomonas sp. APG4 TaxID=1538656 RepID=UPI00137A5CF8|nr:DUF2249 domain-containing protein [Cellulomonas sp. APG4]NCT92263.1 DUF2249 domain-containing protein [Cellulomonas sp. APG4]